MLDKTHIRDWGGKKKKLKKAGRDAESVASRFSQNSKLWFGKYEDVAIRDVSEDYLWWLLSWHEEGKFWRMDGLCLFLRRYLLKGARRPTGVLHGPEDEAVSLAAPWE